ncbi:alpha/beta hydrolase [Halobaculum sp. MBLA0147]|uniref:alpha/beta hydrolase n=1 Tax=Halobaculum sp. MBLA0147 TaxID=3079934 RepID=UPI00352487B1
MSRETTLHVDDERYPGRVTRPDEPTDGGLLIVPGATHGPFEDVFDDLATAAAADGHLVARFQTWADTDVLQTKTASDHATDLRAAVAWLRDRGCESVAVVAKSFGGRLVLDTIPEVPDRLVLWAPAILHGDHDDAPSVDDETLTAIRTPTRILQGDADETVTVDNAAGLADALPNGELVTLAGEDHSFLGDRERVVEETLAFLSEP